MAIFTPLPSRSKFFDDVPVTKIKDLPLTCRTIKDCSICFLPLTDESDPIVLHGMHAFCKECIMPWLEQSEQCPYCRQEVLSSRSVPQQYLDWRIRQFLVIDPKRVPDGTLIFDEDITLILNDALEQDLHLDNAIRRLTREQFPGRLLAKYHGQAEWIAERHDTLVAWRREMYMNARGNVVWSDFDFPEAMTREVPRRDPSTYLRINVRQAIMSVENAQNTEYRRHWNVVNEIYNRDRSRDRTVTDYEPTPMPTEIELHPMFESVRQTIMDAVLEVANTRQTAQDFYTLLEKRVFDCLSSTHDRAVRGEREAVAMARFAVTLVAGVVEGQRASKTEKLPVFRPVI